jgi:N-acetylmuramoyl-L-alanine amidase
MKRYLAVLLTLALVLAALPQAVGGYSLGESEDGYAPLQYGDSGDAVLAVQQRLKDLGYYSGKVSGNFLDGTRAAIRQFQADYGLEQTGVVDGEPKRC